MLSINLKGAQLSLELFRPVAIEPLNRFSLCTISLRYSTVAQGQNNDHADAQTKHYQKECPHCFLPINRATAQAMMPRPPNHVSMLMTSAVIQFIHSLSLFAEAVADVECC